MLSRCQKTAKATTHTSIAMQATRNEMDIVEIKKLQRQTRKTQKTRKIRETVSVSLRKNANIISVNHFTEDMMDSFNCVTGRSIHLDYKEENERWTPIKCNRIESIKSTSATLP